LILELKSLIWGEVCIGDLNSKINRLGQATNKKCKNQQLQ